MKKVELYEFQNLEKQIRDSVFEKFTNDEVEFEMAGVNEEDIRTDAQFLDVFGCTKRYAESTPAFVGSCFYERNKVSIDAHVLEIANDGLYTKDGRWVMWINTEEEI